MTSSTAEQECPFCGGSTECPHFVAERVFDAYELVSGGEAEVRWESWRWSLSEALAEWRFARAELPADAMTPSSCEFWLSASDAFHWLSEMVPDDDEYAITQQDVAEALYELMNEDVYHYVAQIAEAELAGDQWREGSREIGAVSETAELALWFRERESAMEKIGSVIARDCAAFRGAAKMAKLRRIQAS